ncbi:Hypothetical predicted protein, partial [Mytilus galloprovincialis]
MICLIRHLTQIQVSDSLPIPTDISEGADLSRLKYYRNQVAHCDNGVLTDHQFNDYWTEISQHKLLVLVNETTEEDPFEDKISNNSKSESKEAVDVIHKCYG